MCILHFIGHIIFSEQLEEKNRLKFRFSVTSEVGKWLNLFDLGLYESYLLANGFDDLCFLVSLS